MRARPCAWIDVPCACPSRRSRVRTCLVSRWFWLRRLAFLARSPAALIRPPVGTAGGVAWARLICASRSGVRTRWTGRPSSSSPRLRGDRLFGCLKVSQRLLDAIAAVHAGFLPGPPQITDAHNLDLRPGSPSNTNWHCSAFGPSVVVSEVDQWSGLAQSVHRRRKRIPCGPLLACCPDWFERRRSAFGLRTGISDHRRDSR